MFPLVITGSAHVIVSLRDSLRLSIAMRSTGGDGASIKLGESLGIILLHSILAHYLHVTIHSYVVFIGEL